MKFGISFTATSMNQAGALVHVYTDGSVQLNHGGTEMGQGLFIKVAQVVADEFGIDARPRQDHARPTTEKVPNTSPTAASAGSDLNGKAAQAAARAIKERLARCAAALLGRQSRRRSSSPPARCGSARRSLELRRAGRATPIAARVSLSATGFYRTPKIHYDRARRIAAGRSTISPMAPR